MHEGWKHWGFGAEVAAMISGACHRLAGRADRARRRADVPMPYNDKLERAVIPSQNDIADAVRRVCYR